MWMTIYTIYLHPQAGRWRLLPLPVPGQAALVGGVRRPPRFGRADHLIGQRLHLPIAPGACHLVQPRLEQTGSGPSTAGWGAGDRPGTSVPTP